MRVRAASDLALPHPLRAQWSQESKWSQKVCTVENVVDDTLEIVGVVGILHLTTVGPPEIELVDQLWFARRGTDSTSYRGTEALQESIIAVALKIRVAGGYSAISEILHHTRVRERVEITAHDHGDTGHPGDRSLEPYPPLTLRPHDNRIQLISEHQSLNELHVCILRVPVNVGIGHQDMLTRQVHAGAVLDLKESGNADVVLEHDPVEHGIGALCVGHGQLVELDEVVFQQSEPEAREVGWGRWGEGGGVREMG